jgi:GNAT superfamily N-acetyltransferase
MARAAVRPAAPADVDDIVRIQAATWRVAYTGLVPDSAITRLHDQASRRAWVAAVTAGTGFHVFVATEGAEAVGFCAAAHYAAAHYAAATGPGVAEIGTLLVEPRWGRRGHGGRLLAAAAEALRGYGAERGQAWVPEADAASRRFYAGAGWAPDGAVRTLDTGDGTLREIRLIGPLDLYLVP